MPRFTSYEVWAETLQTEKPALYVPDEAVSNKIINNLVKLGVAVGVRVEMEPNYIVGNNIQPEEVPNQIVVGSRVSSKSVVKDLSIIF
ncbi:hypothetical protein [uncultured Azonexus sp.]|uniref:hypothetical protein n=1 Tax=uncultured Azonexus sp. TaxID=520307 RepID=UPI0026114244|nr:hypothetical protein [uncultured Azonexus sp.]